MLITRYFAMKMLFFILQEISVRTVQGSWLRNLTSFLNESILSTTFTAQRKLPLLFRKKLAPKPGVSNKFAAGIKLQWCLFWKGTEHGFNFPPDRPLLFYCNNYVRNSVSDSTLQLFYSSSSFSSRFLFSLPPFPKIKLFKNTWYRKVSSTV